MESPERVIFVGELCDRRVINPWNCATRAFLNSASRQIYLPTSGDFMMAACILSITEAQLVFMAQNLRLAYVSFGELQNR
jgi:hypothetical protein